MRNTQSGNHPLYRVYHLDRAGHIEYAEVIDACDDTDAVERIHALAIGHAVELWDRARFIAKSEPPFDAMVPTPVIVRNDSRALADEVLDLPIDLLLDEPFAKSGGR